MNCLILFSGTRSFEKVLQPKGHKCYGVDICPIFNPHFCVDILKWDYKEDLKDIKIDYLHASPVCREFTMLKNANVFRRDLGLGMSLIEKTIEILEWLLHRNPKLIYTIENPRGLMRKLPMMTQFKRITTSYCMYSYPYMKPTDFWYGGFDLKLKMCSLRNKKGGYPDACKFRKDNNMNHPVRIGWSSDNQTQDGKYFSQLKKDNPIKYKNYNGTFFRYRIPKPLIESIITQLEKEHINENSPDKNKDDSTGNKV